MGPLGELGALFNPGMRHEMEERRQKQMLREEEGTGRKGNLRIDLESGVVLIPGQAGPAADSTASTQDPAADSTAGAADPAVDPADPADPARDRSPEGGVRDEHGGASRSPARSAAKRGEPQQASRSARSVPSGKARRTARGSATPEGTPRAAPSGKARRTR